MNQTLCRNCASRRRLLLPYLLLLGVSVLKAQTAAPPTPAAASTLEIPTLVVDHDHRPVSDLRLDQFHIQVDDRPAFAPSAMRIEKTEPITLTILIDASRDSFHDLKDLGKSLAGIAPTMFLPQDRVSVYALDCTLLRSLFNALATADALQNAVAAALSNPALHDHDKYPNCGKSVHLWDNAATALSGLSKLPGRRVLLLISSGHDGGSKYDWKTVQQYATDQDVAIFAISDQRQVDADTFTPSGLSLQRGFDGSNQPTNYSVAETRKAQDIQLLCANAGGLVLDALPLQRDETFAYFLFIVRNRTILTIPASAYPPGASHKLKITAPLTPFFISPAGAGPPLSAQ
jgi:hypothetical protein